MPAGGEREVREKHESIRGEEENVQITTSTYSHSLVRSGLLPASLTALASYLMWENLSAKATYSRGLGNGKNSQSFLASVFYGAGMFQNLPCDSTVSPTLRTTAGART